MRRTSTLVRDEHPTLETYERVLNNGVMVEHAGDSPRHGVWGSLTVAGVDVVRVDTRVSTRRTLLGTLADRRRDENPGDNEDGDE
jgi:hypothetical protein